MTQAMQRRIDILKALVSGRKIFLHKNHYVWDDGTTFSTLDNGSVSWLFQSGLIQNEVKVITQPPCGDNLTGYVHISESGKFFLMRHAAS